MGKILVIAYERIFLFISQHPGVGVVATGGGLLASFIQESTIIGRWVAAVCAAFMGVVTVYSWIKKSFKGK